MSEPLQLRDVLVDEYLHIHLRLSASNLLRPQQLTKELKAATQHNKRLFALRESLSKQTTVELDSFSADTDPPPALLSSVLADLNWLLYGEQFFDKLRSEPGFSKLPSFYHQRLGTASREIQSDIYFKRLLLAELLPNYFSPPPLIDWPPKLTRSSLVSSELFAQRLRAAQKPGAAYFALYESLSKSTKSRVAGSYLGSQEYNGLLANILSDLNQWIEGETFYCNLLSDRNFQILDEPLRNWLRQAPSQIRANVHFRRHALAEIFPDLIYPPAPINCFLRFAMSDLTNPMQLLSYLSNEIAGQMPGIRISTLSNSLREENKNQLSTFNTNPSKVKFDQLLHSILEDLNQYLCGENFFTVFHSDPSYKRLPESVRTWLNQPSPQILNDIYFRRWILAELWPEHFRLPNFINNHLESAHQVNTMLIHKLSDGPTAFCISGGGIRSATFGLGLIQAMTRFRIFERFEYMSTVSGGGYIGSWLSTWIHREKLSTVLHTLRAEGSKQRQHLSLSNNLEADLKEVAHLRRYRNYLSPNWSFLSSDSWTLLATYLRNLFLNWLVLIPALLAGLAIPRVGVYLIHTPAHAPDELNLLLFSGTALTVWSIAFITWQLALDGKGTSPPARDTSLPSERIACGTMFTWLYLFPLVLAATCLALYWAWLRQAERSHSFGELVFFAITVHIAGVVLGFGFRAITWWIAQSINWLSTKITQRILSRVESQDSNPSTTSVARLTKAITAWLDQSLHWIAWLIAPTLYKIAQFLSRPDKTSSKAQESRDWKNFWKLTGTFLALLISSFISGSTAWLAAEELFNAPNNTPYAYVTFAGPLLLALFLLGGDVLVGLLARWQKDEEREWKARLNAYVLRACTLWIIGSMLVLYGPLWTAEFPYPTLLSSVGGISGLAALLLGFSAKTKATSSGEQEETSLDITRRFSLGIAAPVGVIFLVVLFSWATSALFLKYSMGDIYGHAIQNMDTGGEWSHFRLVGHIHQHILTETNGFTLLGFIVLCVTFSLAISWFIDINKFSLHSLYRDRLVRTFLGASRQRNPDCFTGLDPQDNVEMWRLGTTGEPPLHIVNTSVNLLSVKDTSWQSRKAASFTISPLHCGSPWGKFGYRRSKDYGHNYYRGQSITLGTALAISGAAASPNMGYHSSPAVTFLMSLFNIRLGWWFGNPGSAGEETKMRVLYRWFEETFGPAWKRSTPRFALWWLIKEALGHTREDNAYVYLSDGGHLENLGLYEMVLRRCRFIVVSDAGCDPIYSFEDLGNAIRKIRVDLGIDIEIDLEMLRPQAGQRYSRWHHAVGTIRYDKVDENAPVGILVYIKASLTGNEPADVLEYAGAHPDFPHQSTGDQFFDEAQWAAAGFKDTELGV